MPTTAFCRRCLEFVIDGKKVSVGWKHLQHGMNVWIPHAAINIGGL